MPSRIEGFTGQDITNSRTGQRMVFRTTASDSNGELLAVECWSPPDGPGIPPEPVHTHPNQEKSIRVIEGELAVHANGEERILRAGEEVIVPVDAVHSFWNPSGADAHYWSEFRPALRTAEFFVTLFALARDGKLNKDGMPSMPQIMSSGERFQGEIMVVSPPPLIQKVSFALLGPLMRAFGYHPEHE